MQTTIYHAKFDKTFTNDIINKLKNGAIGIFPTDTVYGIGCDAFNETAIQTLFTIKKRALNKPINILVSDTNMVNNYVTNISPIERKLMEAFWPGVLTIIFQKDAIIPNLLTSGLDSVGIRMPRNDICLDIIKKLGRPLAMSSANISKQAPGEDLNSLLLDFAQKVDFIIDSGRIANGVPSTIVKVDNNEVKILRKGNISINDIKAKLGGNIKCLKI